MIGSCLLSKSFFLCGEMPGGQISDMGAWSKFAMQKNSLPRYKTAKKSASFKRIFSTFFAMQKNLSAGYEKTPFSVSQAQIILHSEKARGKPVCFRPKSSHFFAGDRKIFHREIGLCHPTPDNSFPQA